MIFISFDVGGSGIRWLVVDKDRNVIQKAKTHYTNVSGGSNPYDAISVITERLSKLEHKEAEITIAYPGPCQNNRKPHLLPTMFGEDELEAKKFSTHLEASILSAFNSVRISRLNDVTAAAYSIKDVNPFHLIVLGTGIGWETFVNGRPIECTSLMGGEICNMRLSQASLMMDRNAGYCKDEKVCLETVNSSYTRCLDSGDIESIGILLGKIIAINMLTNGISRVYMAGGIIASENARTILRLAVNSQIHTMNPYPSKPAQCKLAILSETHPALRGGIEYMYLTKGL